MKILPLSGLLLVMLPGLAILLGVPQELEPAADVPRTRSVAVLVPEGAALLELAGPVEVLSRASHGGGRAVRDGGRVEEQAAFEVMIVAPTRRPVRTRSGVRIEPDLALAECHSVDVLVVLGGDLGAVLEDAQTMAELRRIAQEAEVRMSVGTGSEVLGALGLLDGVEVKAPVTLDGAGRRDPDAGSVITCATGVAGIDGALHLTARLLGKDAARHTAEVLGYAWSEASLEGPADPGQRVSVMGPSPAERLYAGAIAQVREGEFARAIEGLRGALAAGLGSPQRILTDAALTPLRNDAPSRLALTRLLTDTGVVDASARPREPIVGLPCEGCDAVFDGLPPVLGSRVRIAPGDEPGEPLVLEGRVFGPEGDPVQGVIVYAFHTDATGVYPPAPASLGQAARRHGRLRGWAMTDAQGRYRFDTIRPARYPSGAEPAHVHLHVIEVGRCTYYVDAVHFADDPLLSPQERERLSTGRGGSGLVRPHRDAEGTWRVTRDIRLGEEVPGYPKRRR